jgi:hypothetical protein
MEKEAPDAIGGIPIATGIHVVATATLCSKAVTKAELELASLILRQDPRRTLPRELAGSIDTFNRQMDVAIESCNGSAGESTRAARRARLASDLERAGLVLIDSLTLAELLERQLAGGADLTFADELADGEEIFVGDVGRNPLPVPA